MTITMQTVSQASVSECMSIIQHLTLDENVKQINEYAFRSFSALQSVKFGPNIESIGRWAFYSCSLLHTLKFEITIPCTCDETAFQESYSIKTMAAVDGSGFYVDSSGALYHNQVFLKFPIGTSGTYTLKPECTTIATTSFARTDLTTLVLSAHLTEIRYAAFYMSKFEGIDVPESSFFELENGVLYKGNTAYWTPIQYTGTVALRDGTTMLADHFGTGAQMSKVVFPIGFMSCSSHSFSGCARLKRIEFLGVFPTGFGSYISKNGVLRFVILPCNSTQTDLPYEFAIPIKIKHACTSSSAFTVSPRSKLKLVILLFNQIFVV